MAQQRAPNRPQLSQLQGWGKTFAYQRQQLASKPADVVFVGDSLTKFWTSIGKAVWQIEFRAVNFGIAGDRTENILFRVTQVNLAAHAPRMFVLLAGTNNLSRETPDSPEETVLAIKTIVDYIVKQCPESKVFLLTLPPNGYEPSSPLRKRVIETNRRLKELIVPEQVKVLDIYPVFTDDAHRWKRGMTIDGTHFSQRGYDYLARTLKPAIDSLRSEPKAHHSSSGMVTEIESREMPIPSLSPTLRQILSALTLLCAVSGLSAQEPALSLMTSHDRVELAVGAQKVTFSRGGAADTDAFALTTQVRTGDGWAPLFDAGLPLLSGPSFNLAPTEYAVESDTAEHKAVALRGEHQSLGYQYEIRAEASADSPLIKLTMTCRLPSGLTLSGLEPVAALWMRNKAPVFTVDQGPDSLYGSLGIPHNFGFPAAYLWDDGKEAAVFFDMTPMTWFSPGGIYRFHDIRIMTHTANGLSGVGMHLKKVSGDRLPEGDMVTVLYLHSAPWQRRSELLKFQ